MTSHGQINSKRPEALRIVGQNRSEVNLHYSADGVHHGHPSFVPGQHPVFSSKTSAIL